MSEQSKTDQFALSPELAALHARLAQLVPSAPRIDRDELMFAAGRAAERAGSRGLGARSSSATGSFSARFWPAATFSMTAATLLLATMLIWQEQPEPHAYPTTTPRTAAASTSDGTTTTRADIGNLPKRPRATYGYLAIRDMALAGGVGEFATEFGHVAPEAAPRRKLATARQLLDELLAEAARERS